MTVVRPRVIDVVKRSRRVVITLACGHHRQMSPIHYKLFFKGRTSVLCIPCSLHARKYGVAQ